MAEISDLCTPKRKNKAEKCEWQRNININNRMKGKEYNSLSKTGVCQKPERQMGEPCSSRFCAKSTLRHCTKFTECVRKEIFNLFWEMTWDQKRLYVTGLVSFSDKKKCSQNSTRTKTISYFLRINSKRLQVCRNMFHSTLGLKEKMVRNWINKSGDHGTQISPEKASGLHKQFKQNSATGIRYKEKRNFLRKWLDMLPKMESHYCRKRSKKLYLDTSFTSYQEVYRLYSEECNSDKENRDMKLSYPIFSEVFKDLNISLFKPKKDECDVCVSYKAKNLPQEDYELHREKVDIMREEKKNDIKNAESLLCAVFFMDTQAVKLVPQLNASASYYKMKLQIHNFTIYNAVTHESHNYVWDETNGNLVASVFATCITKHLENFLIGTPHIHHIILYSDGCFYQNRNVTLSNALLAFCEKTGITIEQKYFISGHTQMECDATHSLIERKIRKKQINLPSQFLELIREARKDPFPLKAKQLSYDYFLDFESIPKRYTSIRPGRSCGDPTVNMLRALGYDSSGLLYYKTNINAEYELLPYKSRKCDKDITPTWLYKERIPINIKKWEHLQYLKKFIPSDCHTFYDSLPHSL